MAWIRYLHHRQATVANYLASDARKWSSQGDAQYNPLQFGTDEAIEALETRCLAEGTLIAVSASGHRRTYYMDARQEVGVCSGEFTTFVFVETTSGEYHGRPISKSALKQLGVEI